MKDRLDLKRIHRQVVAARGGSLIGAKVLDYERVTDSLVKAAVQFSAEGSAEEYRAALGKALGGLATGVDNTFTELTSDAPVYIGYIAHNPEVKEFTKEQQAALADRKGPLRVVAKNMLLDESDQSLWETRESAGGKFLVRTAKEDLSELLSSVSKPSPTLRTGELLAKTHGVVAARSFVQFIDRDTAELGYGYALESTATTVKVLAFGAADEPMEVPVADVVQVADLEGEDTEQAPFEIPASSADAKKLRDYFQKLYGHAPFFFEKLIKTINEGTKF